MMKSPAAAVTLSAILTALAASPLLAQPQQTAPVAIAQGSTAPPKPAVTTTQRRWLKADARVCLEFPTDMQVVACSEKYR